MSFTVTRKTGSLVKPVEPTPTETLELSAIDRLAVLRCNARTLHVFRQGPDAANVIRQALSKALVPYYPLAGRLTYNSHGLLQIECCGQGVWFVEASASCSLDSVGYFDNVECIPYGQLLPEFVPKDEDTEPLVQMQVTRFDCGGFVIGLIFCHSICDGLGAAQFLNAVGELARNSHPLSVPPIWHRHFSPPQHHHQNLPPPLPPTPNYTLQHANIDIPLNKITQLKTQFTQSTHQNCSTFEAIAAQLWKTRTQSINFNPDTQLKLVFFANGRHVLEPPLPKGFYGNCFFPVTVTISSEKLTRMSDSEVVKLIQEGKRNLGVEMRKYLAGGGGGEDPFAPPLEYTTLFISEWGRLGFNEVDYGWGKPVHVVPIQGSAIIPVGIVGSLPSPEKGVRLMTWCVEELHRSEFDRRMNNLG